MTHSGSDAAGIHRKTGRWRGIVLALIIAAPMLCSYGLVSAAATPAATEPPPIKTCGGAGTPCAAQAHQCGGGAGAVKTSIDIGCRGSGSALTDMAFALVRFLSIGVGIIIVGSMIVAGIQYTTSRDDPGAVARAKDRIKNNIIALLIYIFAYAILNFMIPGGFFG